MKNQGGEIDEQNRLGEWRGQSSASMSAHKYEIKNEMLCSINGESQLLDWLRNDGKLEIVWGLTWDISMHEFIKDFDEESTQNLVIELNVLSFSLSLSSPLEQSHPQGLLQSLKAKNEIT